MTAALASAGDGPKRFARWAFTCQTCGQTGAAGDPYAWSRNPGDKGKAWHWACRPGAADPAVAPTSAETPMAVTPAQGNGSAPPPASSSGDLGALIAAAVAPLLDGKIKAGLDADAVRVLVDDALDENQAALGAYVDAKLAALSMPLRIEVTQRDTGTVTDIGLAHALFPDLLTLVQAREHVYLYGPSGAGKSSAVPQIARALGLRTAHLSTNPATPESRLLGYKAAGGEYQSTPFRQCYEQGGVFAWEEADNAHPALQNTINTGLANGTMSFPDGMVDRHPDFVLVADGNTAGLGGDLAFPERRAFDPAFRDRFVVLHWPIDTALETACTDAQGAGEAGQTWLSWIRALRTHAATIAPRLVVSPRASMRGAKLLRLTDWPVETIAERTVFKGLDPATVRTLLAACPLPTTCRP